MKYPMIGFITMAILGLLIGSCSRESTLEPEWLGAATFPSIANFSIFSNEGIHPDKSVLEDDDNPFAVSGVTQSGKWLSITNAIGDYYRWATVLADAPSGEAQFYTGKALENLYLKYNSITFKNQALRAYQNVLDYFPYDLTYLQAGGAPSSIGVWACDAIANLGGVPVGYMVSGGKLVRIVH